MAGAAAAFGATTNVIGTLLFAYLAAKPFLDKNINNEITTNYQRQVNLINSMINKGQLDRAEVDKALENASINTDRLTRALDGATRGSKAFKMAQDMSVAYAKHRRDNLQKRDIIDRNVAYLTSEKERIADETQRLKEQVASTPINLPGTVKLPTALTNPSGLVPITQGAVGKSNN